MNGFADINLLLFRNRQLYLENKQTNSHFDFQAVHVVKEVSQFAREKQAYLSELKAKYKNLLQQVGDYKESYKNPKERYDVHNDPGKPPKMTLADIAEKVSGNYKQPRSCLNDALIEMHKMWICMILQSPKSKAPMLYTALCFKVNSWKDGFSMTQIETEYAVSGLLYAMRLVIWLHLLWTEDHMTAFNIWRLGFLNNCELCPARLLYHYHRINVRC